MRWWRLATFIPTLFLLLKYSYFPPRDQRAWPGIVFICLIFGFAGNWSRRLAGDKIPVVVNR